MSIAGLEGSSLYKETKCLTTPSLREEREVADVSSLSKLMVKISVKFDAKFA